MKAWNLKLMIIALISVILSSCEPSVPQSTIRVKGSESLQKSFERLMTNFQVENDSIAIQLSGGGSLSGIDALINGDADIALVSNQQLGDSLLGAEYQSQIIAYDALVLAVNKSNILKHLTDEQVRAIYTGEVENWFDLGGAQQALQTYGRGDQSGTQDFFMHYFQMKPEEITLKEVEDNLKMIDMITQYPGAIGFFGIGYLTADVQGLALFNQEKKEFIEPSFYMVMNGDYPLTRSLRIYYPKSASKELKVFLEYVLSGKGQTQISLSGLLPAMIMN